jgi:hypothetical protein
MGLALGILLAGVVLAAIACTVLLCRRPEVELTGTLANPLTNTRVGQIILPLKDHTAWKLHVLKAPWELSRLVGRNIDVKCGKDFPDYTDRGRIRVSVFAQHEGRTVTLRGTLTGGDERPCILVTAIESEGG